VSPTIDSIESEVLERVDPMESLEWDCPCCDRRFQRRFLRPDEVEQRYRCPLSLRIEIDGPDARNEHLEAHFRPTETYRQRYRVLPVQSGRLNRAVQD
jgi:hypothetical protein